MKHLLSYCLFSLLSIVHAENPFNWEQLVVLPPGFHIVEGNQILHFKSANKPYWDNQESKEFVQRYLADAKALTSDAEVLRYASDQVRLNGLFIELGVCTGKTINFIAALNPHQKVYGFDSFAGLPEDWVKGPKVIEKGTFAFKNDDLLPPVLHNVILLKGLFEESLPSFSMSQPSSLPIAFLHIDCDLYSSTKTAFEAFADRIVPGTIIVFDEFYNYPGYDHHEYKALQEFLAKSGYQVRYLAYNTNHEQVALEVIQSTSLDSESKQ